MTSLGRNVALSLVVLVVGCVVASPPSAAAQEVRGWTTSSFQLVELRPLQRISLDPATLERDDAGNFLFGGEVVDCTPGIECVVFLPDRVEVATVGTQDLGFTAWDLGLRGLSATGLLRLRTGFGSDFVWPRSDDDFDALLAYAELARDRFRVRVGRQETLSGLGFTGYDGVSVLVVPRPRVRAELYGGRSLARGLAEPRNEALRAIEDFVPDQEAYLVGAFGQLRVGNSTEVGLRYQREIWADRSGLVSERASLDVRSGDLGAYRVRGSLDYDFGFGRVGKSELQVERAFPSAGLVASVQGRRYVPYFELSTVWGFFSPVAYHELLGRLTWSDEATSAFASGGWRTYGDTDTPVIFDPLEDDGWRALAGATRRVSERWTASARYDLEWGVGAFLSSAETSLRYEPTDRLEVGLQGTAFQQFEEFRVGDGRVYGGGLTLGFDVRQDTRFDGGAAVYRHTRDGAPGDRLWNQTRLWASVRYDFGRDPARPPVRLRR